MSMNTEPVPSMSPAVYFRRSLLQLEGIAIAPDKANLWRNTQVDVFCAQESTAIVAGYVYSTKTSEPTRIIVAIQDGQKFQSEILPLKYDSKNNNIIGVLQFLQYIPLPQRIECTKWIIANAERYSDETKVEFYMHILETFSDLRNVPLRQDMYGILEEKAVFESIQAVLNKVPGDKIQYVMDTIISERSRDLAISDRLYDVITTVIESRSMQPVLKSAEPVVYSIKDKITNPFEGDITPQLVQSRLDEIPFTTYPGNRNITYGQAEFVQLDAIVGGANMESWNNILTENPRGIELVTKYVNDYQNGVMSIGGQRDTDPIHLVKIGNQYWVYSQGRHRISALKALRVKEIPAIVSVLKTY